MQILRARDIRALDRAAGDSLGLMERAGRGCAQVILGLPNAGRRDMQVFCGKGNNGGDGLVIARYLADEGCRVKVYLTHDPAALTPEARANLERLPASVKRVELAGGKVQPDFGALLGEDDIVIDALLGVGLRGERLEEPYAGIIASLNRFPGTIVAIDVPSGTGEDNGQVMSPALKASHTLTIGYPKVGLFLEPAAFHVGQLEVIPLDYPESALSDYPPRLEILDPAEVARHLVPRDPAGHKGTYGHLLIIGGSRGMPGSVALAAAAAYRAGVGSVVVATAASAQAVVAGFSREAMTVALEETVEGVIAPQAMRQLLPWLDWATTLALGPGLTTAPAARALVATILDHWEGPLVLDADGLKIAGQHLDRLAERELPVICTPHLGEAATLLHRDREEIQHRRLDIVEEAARDHHLVLLLKGYRPVIAAPDGRVSISTVGNPGLGTAGTGDVLTGIIGALLAQGLPPYEAARVGAYLHGAAGDRAAAVKGEISLIAGDLIDELPSVIRELGTH